MSFAPYRPRQGYYARGVAAAGLLLLFLFGCSRLFDELSQAEALTVLNLKVSWAALWAGGVFVVLGGLTCLLTVGFRTGIAPVDQLTGSFIDLLVETQTELQKVSWPSKDQLVNSTTVVLVCMILLGAFLFVVDQFVGWIMIQLRVLPA